MYLFFLRTPNYILYSNFTSWLLVLSFPLQLKTSHSSYNHGFPSYDKFKPIVVNIGRVPHAQKMNLEFLMTLGKILHLVWLNQVIILVLD
jgi:hypothetical protein